MAPQFLSVDPLRSRCFYLAIVFLSLPQGCIGKSRVPAFTRAGGAIAPGSLRAMGSRPFYFFFVDLICSITLLLLLLQFHTWHKTT